MSVDRLDEWRGEVTQALQAWRLDRRDNEDRLLLLVYEELRRMADRFLRGERPGHTLQTTDLVHEAYLRLVDQRCVDWRSRRHFFAISARVMRRILVDHARARARQKRGGRADRVAFEDMTDLGIERACELVVLDQALSELAVSEPRRAAVVELRFFGGFSVEETAEILDVSTATVGRYWRVARAWLFREIRGRDAPSEDGSRPTSPASTVARASS